MEKEKKPRFGSFIATSEQAQAPKEVPVDASTVAMPERPAPAQPAPQAIPVAPLREEKRPFSTRVRPSQKTALDSFVMDLKRAGWPVSQEAVLEELLRLLEEDATVRQTVTGRLVRL